MDRPNLTSLGAGTRNMQLSRALLIQRLSERERHIRANRSRTPEPMVFNAPGSVDAFDRAGADQGPMVPFYEASARSVSRLLPIGGTVLELGCGSARCATHLALSRPDAAVIGIDLAQDMLQRGHDLLERAGLDDRVTLREGDMTDLDAMSDVTPQVVMASLSLHHLPSTEELHRCLASIARLVARSGCALWLLDLARLRDPSTYAELLALSLNITGRLREDALASEAAAWTLDELTAALASARVSCHSQLLEPLSLVQSHWHPAAGGVRGQPEGAWTPAALTPAVAAEAAAIDRQLGVRLGSTEKL